MMQKMTQWFSDLGFFRHRKARIEITVETNETWGVEWFRQSRGELCPTCGAETIFIPSNLGAQVVRVEEELIDGLIENGRVHFSEGGEDERLICLSSLKRSTEKHSVEKTTIES
jgi:hypothetical protein